MNNFIKKIKVLLNRENQKQLASLALFSIIISIIETVGISAIMPFIDVSTNFQSIHENKYYSSIYIFFEFDSEIDFAIYFGLVLLCFYLFRAVANIFYNYQMTHFSHTLYALITQKLFRKYLSMQYQDYSTKNSSLLTKNIITEASLSTNVISAVLLMISEFLVIFFLYILMLFVNWEITLVFTFILAIMLLFLSKTISKKIKKLGENRAEIQSDFYELLNQFFGNFKQIKLQSKRWDKALVSKFNKIVNTYSHMNIVNGALAVIPRIFLETTGFSLIVLTLVYLLYSTQGNVLYILPTLSLFVLALYRLLPSVNRIVKGYNTIMYYHKSIDIIGSELQIPVENLGVKKVSFDKNISLSEVCFEYKDQTQVLKNINLIINKGDSVAFVGDSGSGKTTLVDLIIGLYFPNKGEIRIDGLLLSDQNIQNWRSQIGYIPQQAYLFDGTVAENVCFGREYSKDYLIKVLKQANIYDFLQTKEGVDTLVGEGGIQLSGGQKQRVVIARALYGDPEILVLDEATSSLDEETEKRIMNEVYRISHDKTLVIIAHRLTTIKNCDKVYQIHNGNIVDFF